MARRRQGGLDDRYEISVRRGRAASLCLRLVGASLVLPHVELLTATAFAALPQRQHEIDSMEPEAVADLIRAGLPGAEVNVTGDGAHFEAVVISAAFDGLSPIKKQRLVMETVKPQIASGELHALSIKALTPTRATD